MLKYVLLTTPPVPNQPILLFMYSLNRISLSLLVKLVFPFQNLYLCLEKVYNQYLFGNYMTEKILG